MVLSTPVQAGLSVNKIQKTENPSTKKQKRLKRITDKFSTLTGKQLGVISMLIGLVALGLILSTLFYFTTGVFVTLGLPGILGLGALFFGVLSRRKGGKEGFWYRLIGLVAGGVVLHLIIGVLSFVYINFSIY